MPVGESYHDNFDHAIFGELQTVRNGGRLRVLVF